VAALSSSSTLLFVIIEAVKKGQMLSTLEIFGLLFGGYGALVLTVPQYLAKLCCFCCLDKLHGDEEREDKVELEAYN